MKEALGDLWTYEPADARVITTNGIVAGDVISGTRHAVMGKGTAEQAAKRYPKLDSYFGMLLDQHGNRPMVLLHIEGELPEPELPRKYEYVVLVSMPVKHHWRERADLDLIIDSATKIVEMADKFGWRYVVMPRPGCGNGKLDWTIVQANIAPILDDRFTVLDYAPENARSEV